MQSSFLDLLSNLLDTLYGCILLLPHIGMLFKQSNLVLEGLCLHAGLTGYLVVVPRHTIWLDLSMTKTCGPRGICEVDSNWLDHGYLTRMGSVWKQTISALW